ncbi:MAG: ABC transporter permease [Nitrospirae bacterium]|nr:ABC transporter permease [Nitrospirota bacterium]MBI3803310.1 ABC transporter permease [Candidatus Manganitrophaceae bacterium]
MRQLVYFVRSAIENIQTNRLIAFFSLISLSLTLMLFGVFLLFYYNVEILLRSMQEDVQFSIYLSEGADDDAIRVIKDKLSSDDRISSVKYISKGEALDIFKKEFHDESLLKSLGGNPLPASFEVKVKAAYQEPRQLSVMVDRFKKLSGVEEVEFGSEWLQNLDAFLKLLRKIGIGIGGLLAVAIVTIIANTVRLHFYNRKDEIEILWLIGATHRFIKIPFFIEGALIGLLSGGMSVLMLFGIFRAAQTHLQSIGGMIGGFLNLLFLPLPFLLGITLGGGVLGGIAGFVSLSALMRPQIPADGQKRG